MTKIAYQDCTACTNLRTYPNPSQVMNCSDFRVRKTGECPARADVSAFVWRPDLESAEAAS